jgi:hypothetical protein
MSPLTAENCPQCGAGLHAFGEQIICPYCGSRLIRDPGTGSSGAGTQNGFVRGMRMKTIACMDYQGIGAEAFRMLVPNGWEFSGGVHWPMSNPGMPAVLAFQVRNPGGLEAFEFFPTLAFFWSNHPMYRMSFPRGSLYYGNEVQPPCGAIQALREIVAPRYRRQVGAIEWLGQESCQDGLPELAAQVRELNPNAPSGTAISDGGKVRIRYNRQGSASVEEEIFALVQVQRNAAPALMGMMESIFWTIDYIFSFQAPSGKLDSLTDLFKTMLGSFRLNPQWFGRYLQISQHMIQGQIQHIQQIGQLSRYLSQTNNQISDMMMSSYYQRQATMDRLSNSFSQAIRGVEEYQDPFAGRGVELPGGYGHAWANTLGEYIVTDDPNFNPNIGSNLSWEPMNRR